MLCYIGNPQLRKTLLILELGNDFLCYSSNALVHLTRVVSTVYFIKSPCYEAEVLCWRLWQYCFHDDIIKWKHFPRYCPFVRGIHRSPRNSPHKGQWRGPLMFFICVWINGWVNNGKAGDLRRHRAHYDVTAMFVMPSYKGNWTIPSIPEMTSYTYDGVSYEIKIRWYSVLLYALRQSTNGISMVNVCIFLYSE